MGLLQLPVSGSAVHLSQPSGADEMLVLEGAEPLHAGLALLARVAPLSEQDGEGGWSDQAVTDFEWALLRLRRMLFGDPVRSDFLCPNPDCRERVEIEFGLRQYLAQIRPQRPRAVLPCENRPDWFLFGQARFRLPSVSDQIEARAAEQAGSEPEGRAGARVLALRCIAPTDAPARLKGRIERAMASMAPQLSGPVDGVCPCCGTTVEAMFDVPSFVVGELRRAFRTTAAEVDLIASAYHWSEAEILSLPRQRRQAYAERIQLRRKAA